MSSMESHLIKVTKSVIYSLNNIFDGINIGLLYHNNITVHLLSLHLQWLEVNQNEVVSKK